MKIYAINVIVESNSYVAYDLSDFGFFQYYTIKNFIEFLTQELQQSALPKDKPFLQKIEQKLETKQASIHNYQLLGKSIVVYVDGEYPDLAVRNLLKLINQLEPSKIQAEINKYILEFQDPAKLDILFKIRADLDATIVTVHKTIEAVLDRGKKLDDLVKESEVLSESSKLFYTAAKKNNRCCSIS